MHGGTIGKYDCRTKCRARPRVTPRHHRRHIIAARIETWNGGSVVTKNARIGVGRKSGADRDVGRPHCKRIEGRRDQRPNARVGFMTGIPIEAVQLGFALTKIDVDAGLGKGIVARDRAYTVARHQHQSFRQALRGLAR